MEKNLRRGILATLAITLIAAAASDFVVTETNAPTFYANFTRLTRQSHYVAPLTDHVYSVWNLGQ
jgi:hypothetical protein